MAGTPLKSVIISYPENTPNSVIDMAKKAIRDAGGKITHEYSLIRGFAAMAPQVALDSVKAFETPYPATIENDQIVTLDDPNDPKFGDSKFAIGG
ncbi:hypothetical protein LOZ10_003004 [Ophidiomyces ophidiicola]|nr:hypothetical protein LOZ10_003004 [Ophidiomyces ophidiicola]